MMTENNRNINTCQGIELGRNRGNCRSAATDFQAKNSTTRSCHGQSLRQGRQSNIPPAASVIDSSSRLYTKDLQTLKEQAARMTLALNNIQAQIEALTEK